MKLYYSKGACSLVVRIIINEIGMASDYEAVDIAAKKTYHGDDYYLINPKGAVPALEIKKGEVLTENAVILQYLADEANAISLLAPIGDLKRYRTLEWLNYVTTELHKSFGPLFSSKYTQDMKDQIMIPMLKTKFEFVDKQLGNKKFLLGDEFTLPDAYLFVMLFWATRLKFEVSAWKNLSNYFNQLKARPAIQKSLTEEGLL